MEVRALISNKEYDERKSTRKKNQTTFLNEALKNSIHNT